MTLNDVLSSNAVQSKAICIQNDYNKDILESEAGHSDLYALTELFGNKAIIIMKFGWGFNKEKNDLFSLKKQLISISFIPWTTKKLEKHEAEFIENIFGNFKKFKNEINIIEDIPIAEYNEKGVPALQIPKSTNFHSILSKYMRSKDSHIIEKWIKGLESGEKPYRPVGDWDTIVYYTNNPSIKIENNEFYFSSEINQNIPDINIAGVSNKELWFYPARKMDQTSKVLFIMKLLSLWNKYEIERHKESFDINKNKNDF